MATITDQLPSQHPTLANPQTKYTDELKEKAWFYLENWETLGDAVPSNVGLTCYLGISRETVNAWNNDLENADFSNLLGRIQVVQVRELIRKGLSGDCNFDVCTLMLAQHGFAFKKELTGADGKSLEPKITLIKNKHI